MGLAGVDSATGECSVGEGWRESDWQAERTCRTNAKKMTILRLPIRQTSFRLSGTLAVPSPRLSASFGSRFHVLEKDQELLDVVIPL